ncbi:MAG: lipid-A-disaccharide synthase [Desulfurivibrio sp.]|nr:lipid-A-disaccharide synthase [Desulfurivibrio sp.]
MSSDSPQADHATGAAPHILIVAGEASGDMHGANLARALRQQAPGVRLSAMGGEALVGEGVELVYEASRLSVVGLVEVLSHLGEIRQALGCLRAFLRRQRPDLLILIDFPDFNLRLAKEAKKLGIPVFYYISPQVWAWRRGRVRTIRRLVDKMAVILPFEQEFYQEHGVAVEFVGHPLLDELGAWVGGQGEELPAPLSAIEEPVAEPAGAAGNRHPLIGLLPGSRRREIAVLLPLFLAAARQLAAELPVAPRFLLPLAPGLKAEQLAEYGLSKAPELAIEVTTAGRHRAMAACDGAIAASGTVTLELALLNVPLVMAYKLSPLTYLLGRWLVDLPHATLVNLVAGREVIPELLQSRATPENICHHLHPLLTATPARAQMLAGLAQVRARLGTPGASRRAAAAALRLLTG